MTTTLYIENRDTSRLTGAYFVVDEKGKRVSGPLPTKYAATKDRKRLVDENGNDYAIGVGRRPK